MTLITDSIYKDIIGIIGTKEVIFKAPLSLYTTFRVGGPADILATPTSIKSLTKLLNYCLHNDIPYFIIGKGSNLIVGDKGIRGVVISTVKHVYASYSDESVFAGCGLEIAKLSRSVADRGLSGLEFACGIPGTVGGAVYMNAGAYEGEISQVVVVSEALAIQSSDSGIPAYDLTLIFEDMHDFSYRHSIFQEKNYIHLNSTFKLERKNKRFIKAEMKRITQAREEKQPLELPSAGSVFRRPKGYYTGQLIQDCGLRGFRIGDAAVSDKHCGFIVNLGKATAKDIKAVIEHVQKRVFDCYGVKLQTEVKFVGEP